MSNPQKQAQLFVLLRFINIIFISWSDTVGWMGTAKTEPICRIRSNLSVLSESVGKEPICPERNVATEPICRLEPICYTDRITAHPS